LKEDYKDYVLKLNEYKNINISDSFYEDWALINQIVLFLKRIGYNPEEQYDDQQLKKFREKIDNVFFSMRIGHGSSSFQEQFTIKWRIKQLLN